MDELIKNISKYISIDDSDIETIKQIFQKKTYEKGELLIEQERRVDKLFYIKSGLVRMYFIDEEGNEVHTYFATDNDFITSFSGFINHHLSAENLKAVQQTNVFYIHYSDFIKQGSFTTKFRTLFAEQNLVCIKKRLDLLQNSKAIEKYNHFLKNTDKKIINGIPLYQIASYLGITAESLSRIRKNQFLTKSQE